MKIEYQQTSVIDKIDMLLHSIYFDTTKYHIASLLEDLQDEISNEEGIIVIPTMGTNSFIQVMGFPDTLKNKIKRRLLLDDDTNS